jgi:hypothetical protein
MVALPNFDGQRWARIRPRPPSRSGPDAPLATTTPVAAPGETTDVTFTTASELADPWLPLPYPPRSTNAQLDGMRWDPEGGSVLIDGGSMRGHVHGCRRRGATPPQELRADTIQRDETVRYRYPADLPPEIATTAAAWTRRVLTVRPDHRDPGSVHGKLQYDDTVPGSTSDRAMVDFLLEDRVGFCQQFATTMGAMLRTLGIPTRLAMGFTPGEAKGSSGRLSVTTENAHVWVEVFFPSFGWVPFEPTPNRQNVEAYPYLDPDGSTPCVNPDGSPCGRGQGNPEAVGGRERGNSTNARGVPASWDHAAAVADRSIPSASRPSPSIPAPSPRATRSSPDSSPPAWRWRSSHRCGRGGGGGGCDMPDRQRAAWSSRRTTCSPTARPSWGTRGLRANKYVRPEPSRASDG